jgi:hypothetical protein
MMSIVKILLACALLLVGVGRTAQAQPRTPADDETLGDGDAIAITVKSETDGPLCYSFSFAQIPYSSDLFISKLRTGSEKDKCGGHWTLALFRLDWRTHVMTLMHPLMETPVGVDQRTVQAAYDPYVERFRDKTWVAFECVGPQISGTSACIAPLSDDGSHIDTNRISIPVMGRDSDEKSDWIYSVSTPKLLSFKGRLYLYWTAIKIGKAPPNRWESVEMRGAEVEVDRDGKIWVKGRAGRPLPSRAPGANLSVMAPAMHDPYANTEVEVQDLFVDREHIIALSSVGGSGPDQTAPCTKPIDSSPGCFRLEITRTTNPLGENSLRQETLISPMLPANPVEYSRIVRDPEGKTYLMANLHPVKVVAAPKSGKALGAGLVLIPFTLSSLRFGPTDKH